MPPKQFRKAKRRPSSARANRVAEIKHDADLAELWEVLQEQKPHSPWVPWRSGANAMGFALEAAKGFFRVGRYPEVLRAFDVLYTLNWSVAHASSEIYHQLQDRLTELETIRVDHSTQPGLKLLQIALRIAQLDIANSSGGGTVYNEFFLSIDWAQVPLYRDLIRRWRCKDVTGIWPESTPELMLESSARLHKLRRAFLTAWDRGMYLVAYTVER